MERAGLMIGWTTTEMREDALKIARALVSDRLAACAQVSGPIESVYRWQGALETSQEFRVTIKFPADREPAIADWLAANHPYDTPQWIAVEATAVAEKYLNWAGGNST